VTFDTEFLADRNVLVVHAHGDGDASVARQFIGTVKACPDYRPGTAILIDGLDSQYLPATIEVGTFPDLIESELPGSRLAFVPRDDAAFGIGRMISTLSGCQGVPFAVFRQSADALAWLASSRDD
jgi:hypothetical protein